MTQQLYRILLGGLYVLDPPRGFVGGGGGGLGSLHHC